MNPSSGTRTLLWFRRQLRTDDQPLFERLDTAQDQVVGVWILDPTEHLTVIDGERRSGSNRMQFLLETVDDLRSSLRAMGTELIIRVGNPAEILPDLIESLDIDCLSFVEEPGTEERRVEREVMDRVRVSVRRLPPETLLELDDPRAFAGELPEVFSSFRRDAEKHLDHGQPRDRPLRVVPVGIPTEVECGRLPGLVDLDLPDSDDEPRAVLDFRGGESSGRDRIREWMHEGDHLGRYKQTRNGMLGPDYSSKFSPWLAIGAISSRRVASETFRYEDERIANDSTYWLRFELLWREFFRLHLLKHGPRLFRLSGPADIRMQWPGDDERFERWRSGRTGVPLIDANMRELSTTGFMSNRGRQIVASFLAKNLGVDWRRGARWFEHALIDYCPAANWGNWAYAAGVGADPRGFRGFDVLKQARNYDARGDYVRHWLPDRLEALHGAAAHVPWEHGGEPPIVDSEASLDAARVRWETATGEVHRGKRGRSVRRRRSRR